MTVASEFGSLCWPKHEYPRVYQRILLGERQDRGLAGCAGRVWAAIVAAFGQIRRTCHRAVPRLARRRRVDAFCRRTAGCFTAAAASRTSDPADAGRRRRRAQGRRSPQTIPAGRISCCPGRTTGACLSPRHARHRAVGDGGELWRPQDQPAGMPGCHDRPIGWLGRCSGRTLEAAAEALETLSPEAWNTIRLSLAEMLLTLARQKSPNAAEASAPAPRPRCCSGFMTRSNASSATPNHAGADRADRRHFRALSAEAVRGTGDNFTHYLRERRLQRCSAELSNPTAAHRRYPISPLAAASTMPRISAARFATVSACRRAHSGNSEAERVIESSAPGPASVAGRRMRSPIRVRIGRRDDRAGRTGAGRTRAPRHRTEPAHHHLPVDATHVHWGFFSRSLTPLIEIASGDTITIETLTQHASDDPERMISGDAGAESVFRWTSEDKTVDRRGAGPMDARSMAAAPAKVLACTSAPGRSPSRAPSPAMSWKSASSTWCRARAANPGFRRPDFRQQRRGLVGLSLQGIAYRAEAARGGDDLRDRHRSDDRTPGRSIPFAGSRRPIPTGSCTRPMIIRACRCARNRRRRHGLLRRHPYPAAAAFRRHRRGARAGLLDSIPPADFGGNLDNWRLGKGAGSICRSRSRGAAFGRRSARSPGRRRICGTAIECSMTGTFEVVLHQKADLAGLRSRI